MGESVSTSHRDLMSRMFSHLPTETDSDGFNGFPPAPPPPPMLARPNTVKSEDVSLVPPPLKRMSTTDTHSDDGGDNTDSPKKSLANSSLDESASSPLSESDTNSNNTDQLVTPPPLRKCIAPPNSSKSRWKPAVPQSTTDIVKNNPLNVDQKNTIQVPDIDELLTDCRVANPVEGSNMVIDDASDDDDEFRPMRVSSKGRVVKKPSWADAYTEHVTTEMEEESGVDWTPERPVRGGKQFYDSFKASNVDSFKPRAPPLIGSALDKSGITHADLHPSMIMDSPPASLLLPFKHGWVRELVIRNPQNEELASMERKQTNADAYYYAPKEYGSVKLRSLVKVQEFLTEKDVPELTGANFSFAKRALYKLPEEFVRLAGKSVGRRGTATATDSAEKKGKVNKSSKGQTNAKAISRSPGIVPDSPKMATCSPLKQIKTEFPSSPLTQSPKHTVAAAQTSGKSQAVQLKRALNSSPSKHRPMIKKIRADKDATARAKQFLTSKDEQSSDVTTTKNTIKVMGPAGKPPSLKRPLPCTDHCKGVANAVPSVQCGVCLLLYHPECINWTSAGRDALFVCSMCIAKTRRVYMADMVVPADKASSQDVAKTSPATKINAPLINEALSKKSSSPASKESNKSRLITIPLHVLNKIDTSSPFALKLNNETFKVNPSRLIKTSTGVKILIKNDQVLKPSEVEIKADSMPAAAQVKHLSLYDLYQDMSKKVSADKSAAVKSNSECSQAGEKNFNDSYSSGAPASPGSDDMPPIITDVRTVSSNSSESLNSHVEAMDTSAATSDGPGEGGDAKTEQTEDLSGEEKKEVSSQKSVDTPSIDSEVADIVHLLVETVENFHRNEQKAKQDSAKVKDVVLDKQHRMNKPTDPRPNMPTPAGSMSEILYDQTTSQKTYGRSVGEASSLLRSLVPKAPPIASTHANIINVLSPQLHTASQLVTASGTRAVPVGPSLLRIGGVNNPTLKSTNHAQSKGVVLLPGKSVTASTISTAGAPVGPIVLSPRPAPVSGVKPVSLISNSSCVSLSVQSIHSASASVAGPHSSSPKILLMKNMYGNGVTSQALTAPVITVASPSLSGATTTSTAGSKLRVITPSFPINTVRLPAPIPKVKVAVNTVPTQTDHTGRVSSLGASGVSSSPGNMSNFCSFYSCLLKIFSYLSLQDRLRAAAVCRMWKMVSADPSLNKSLHCDRTSQWMTVKEISKYVTNKTVSMKLDGLKPPALTTTHLVAWQGLTSFSLNCLNEAGKSWLSESVLTAILGLPQLQRLSIYGGMHSATPLSTLSSLKKCAQLTDLTLHNFSSPHVGSVLDLVSRECSQSARTLCLQICVSENNPFEEDPLDPSSHFTCLEKFKHLQKFELRYSRLEVDSCEAEYLKDTYTTLLPGCDITVSLYDFP